MVVPDGSVSMEWVTACGGRMYEVVRTWVSRGVALSTAEF